MPDGAKLTAAAAPRWIRAASTLGAPLPGRRHVKQATPGISSVFATRCIAAEVRDGGPGRTDRWQWRIQVRKLGGRVGHPAIDHRQHRLDLLDLFFLHGEIVFG